MNNDISSFNRILLRGGWLQSWSLVCYTRRGCLHLRTRPSDPGYTSSNLAIAHLPRRALLSAMVTISSTCTLCFSTSHFFLGSNAGNTSLIQHFQRESTIFCMNSTRLRGFFVSLSGPYNNNNNQLYLMRVTHNSVINWRASGPRS